VIRAVKTSAKVERCRITGIAKRRYEATGVVPHFTDRVEQAGTDMVGIFQRASDR